MRTGERVGKEVNEWLYCGTYSSNKKILATHCTRTVMPLEIILNLGCTEEGEAVMEKAAINTASIY